MSILCLVLGFLCLVGSSSSIDLTTTNDQSAQSTTDNPKTSANPSLSISHSNAASVPGNTDALTTPSISTSPTTISTATQPTPLTTLLTGALTGASSNITSAPVSSSSATPATSIKPEINSGTVTTTGQLPESTATKAISPTLASSNQPEGAPTTVPSQLGNPTTEGLKSSPSATVTETTPSSLDTKPPKDTHISTPTFNSSESPVIKSTSPTTVTITIITTTKSEVPKIPSSSSSVATTAAELSTHKDVNPQKTSEAPKLQKLTGNIEVKCTTIDNGDPYVKIHMKASSICDDNDTEHGRVEDVRSITTHICKAIKPGYQENQDKCIIHLGKINENQLAITEAFIKSPLYTKELYTQLKRNGANLMLFSYDGAEPEDEDVVSIPLISAIVSLAVLLLIIAAAYGCWHQRKARKREQRLTEETQTMENGYHDNPTLEVMETSPEMQEKKGGPNGELGDSWIVPLDNLTREDLEEEEDTHL